MLWNTCTIFSLVKHEKFLQCESAYITKHNKEQTLCLFLQCFISFHSSLYMYICPFQIHSSVELLCLLIIAVELSLRMKWLGFQNFRRHVRTMIKVCWYCNMYPLAFCNILVTDNMWKFLRVSSQNDSWWKGIFLPPNVSNELWNWNLIFFFSCINDDHVIIILVNILG